MAMTRRDWWILAGLALAACLSLWQMWGSGGLPVGHDMSFETVRLVEYRDALSTQIVPRLAPHTYGGLGSPVFVFYSPLFVFAASVFSLAGSLTAGIALWFTLLKIASVLAMFALVRRHMGRVPATALSLLWCTLPYLYTDMYQRNAFSEGTAYLLLPIMLWGFWRAATTRHPVWMLLAAVTGAGFLLSHNITVLMVALPVVPLLLLFGTASRHTLLQKLRTHNHTIFALIWTVLAAFFASAWFLIPAFFDKNSVHIEEVTLGKFFYANNFASLQDLFLQLDSERFVGPALILVLLLALATLFIIAQRKPHTQDSVFFTGILLLLGSVTMMTWLSAPVWHVAPILWFIQFPWRFQVLVSAGLIMTLAGMAISLPPTRLLRTLWYVALAAFIGQSLFVYWYKFERAPLEYSRPENTTIEAIVHDGMKATVGEEYLPATAAKGNSASDMIPLFAVTPQAGVSLLPVLYNGCASQPLGVLAYPYLHLSINGRQIAADADGYLRIPAGSCGTLTLGFTPLQQTAGVISITGFLLLLLALFWKKAYR